MATKNPPKVAFWNYRMFHRQVPDGLGGVEDEYTIREAYYGYDNKVHSWTAEPSSPKGETKLGLMDDMSAMSRAIAEPVIELTPDASALAGGNEP